VDIEIETESNERILFEIQINPDRNILTRGLFTASHIYTGTSTKGDTSGQMAARLPRVICINILGYNIRNDNADAVQPYKILYTKPPHRTAITHFCGYNIQLPRIMEMPADFTDPLYAWGYTLHIAHNEKKSIREVLEMTPELQTYAGTDTGFAQFCKQYNYATVDPSIMKEYVNWVNIELKTEGMREAAWQEGSNTMAINIARNLKKHGMAIQLISNLTGLSITEIENA
jgi:predicted transposase/invertase (TIGR01784 family)